MLESCQLTGTYKLFMKAEILTEQLYEKDTIRIETFSDGVFCIAVTLLSIEIGVELKDHETNRDLLHALVEKWPICLAYVISFINVLLAWIGHHGLFKNLRNTNNSVMIANGILLLIVALVPFPTKTLGLFLLSDALQTAVVFYTGYFVLVSLAFRILWWTASREPRLMIEGITASQIKRTTKNENIGLVSNAAIMGIAFINPIVALVLSFVMWIYWIAFA